MKFSATQEHIDNGLRGDCGRCPVALCFMEQLPNRCWAQIQSRSAKFFVPMSNSTTCGSTRFVLALPPQVSAFIKQFDVFDPKCDYGDTQDQMVPKPFEFEMELSSSLDLSLANA